MQGELRSLHPAADTDNLYFPKVWSLSAVQKRVRFSFYDIRQHGDVSAGGEGLSHETTGG